MKDTIQSQRALFGASRASACLFSVVLFFGSTAPALAQGEQLDQATLLERALQREADLGVTRSRVGSTSYELVVPAGVETPASRKVGALIWVYEGQQIFDETVQPKNEQLVWLDEDRKAFDDATEMLGTVEIDRYGRRWVLADIDRRALEREIQAYDQEVDRLFGPEPVGPIVEPVGKDDMDQAGFALVTPMSWTTSDCDGDGSNDLSRWNSDNRALSSSPMTTRQRKVVLIQSPFGIGSGTMVDSRWVLTAAHVVTSSTGSPLSPSSYDVSTYGNYQSSANSFGVLNITIAPGYSGDGDVSDDYAVLQLDASPGVGWMAISQASNSVIKAADGYNSGYTRFTPGCSIIVPSSINTSLSARRQYWSKGDVFGTTSKRIKTRIDSAKGHSGSPFYYYPGGCCGSHYLTGVLFGFVNPAFGSGYVGGPKGSAIRSWVIANTP